MSATKTIYYEQYFVGGVLEGLTYQAQLDYPESMFPKIYNEYLKREIDKKVTKGMGSPYIIRNVRMMK